MHSNRTPGSAHGRIAVAAARYATNPVADDRDGRKHSFLRLWKHLGSGLSSLAAWLASTRGVAATCRVKGPTGSYITLVS
jgi:hypothetical protein